MRYVPFLVFLVSPWVTLGCLACPLAEGGRRSGSSTVRADWLRAGANVACSRFGGRRSRVLMG